MIPFHKVLISTAIAFCAVFALWALVQARETGSSGLLALGIGFALATIALTYYLRHLKRFLGP